MASLIPCIACQRHVRRQDAQCPFCGTARTPSAGVLREIVSPRDATRATIFALGLSLAGQACGGRTDGDNDPSPPGAGASIGNGDGDGGSGNRTGATGSNGGTSNSGGCEENPLAASAVPSRPTAESHVPIPTRGAAARAALAYRTTTHRPTRAPTTRAAATPDPTAPGAELLRHT